MASAAPKVMIGIVGYSPVLSPYPLGPELMQRLESLSWQGIDVALENMTWGPLHIVQRFQDEGCPCERMVLVGASAVAHEPGRVRCSLWQGGVLDTVAMQSRMYEAVTGVVSLENTLIIGEHFGIWPAELFIVEIDMAEAAFGDLVIATSGESDITGDAAAENFTSVVGFNPRSAIEEIAQSAHALAVNGEKASVTLLSRKAADLVPTRSFSNTNVVGLSKDTADGRAT